MSSNPEIKSERPLFFKELIMFICKFQLKHSFSSFYQYAEEVKQGSINTFLSSQQYQDFIRVFQKKPETFVIVPGIANMLFNEFSLFNQQGMLDQWKLCFCSLLHNLSKRKRGLSYSLRDSKANKVNHDDFSYIASSEKMEDKIIKSVGGDNYSGFCRLKVFQSQTDLLIKECVERYQDETTYTINMIKNFIANNGGIENFSFVSEELLQVVITN